MKVPILIAVSLSFSALGTVVDHEDLGSPAPTATSRKTISRPSFLAVR